MKVKVYLQPKGSIYLSGNKNDTEFLEQYFKEIGLQEVEPECPFCGMRLENAQCKCADFNQSYDKLLGEYGAEAVNVIGGMRVITYFPLIAENVTLKSVVDNENLLNFRTKAKVLGKTFLVSEGAFNGKILKFYIYHQQLMKVYECRIKELSYQPKESEVSLCKYVSQIEPYGKSAKVVYGRYRLEEEKITLARLGYTKYLKKIEKMAKKK